MALSEPVGSTTTSTPPKLNTFLTKKTITQGLLDVALLTANVAQLKYVMSLGSTGANAHPYFYPMVILIWLSILLQVSVGLCLLMMGKTQINNENPGTRAEHLNNAITAQVFLITVINILISSFNIEETIQRSGKIDDWIRELNETECTCLNPLKSFHQSAYNHFKNICN